VIPQDDRKSRPVPGSVDAGLSTAVGLTDVHATDTEVEFVGAAKLVGRFEADSVGLHCGKHLSQVVLVPSSKL